MSETYRIKPLVWRDGKSSSIYEDSIAFLHVVTVGVESYEWWASTCRFSAHARPANSLESAKAAAESWYRSKLLEALEEVK